MRTFSVTFRRRVGVLKPSQRFSADVPVYRLLVIDRAALRLVVRDVVFVISDDS